MTFDEIIDQVAEEASKLIDEYAPQVIDHAEESPEELEDLPEELIEALTLIWDEAIDEVSDEATNVTNTELDSDEETALTDEDKNEYRLAGLYFFLESMRRAMHSIHGTKVAKQIPDDERDQEIEDAIERAKNAVARLVDGELGNTYGSFIQREQMSRGVRSYRWQTVGDSRVRPSHRANEGRIFSWESAPATGHPKTAHGCRCSAIPVEPQASLETLNNHTVLTLTNNGTRKDFHDSGIEVKSMDDPNHVTVNIRGDIGGGGWGDPENETLWEIESFAGITDETTSIKLNINSGGGSYPEGLAMYRFFKSHPAKVTSEVDGWVASAAVFPFLSGDVRIAPEYSELGIHLPYYDTCFCGINHEDAQAIADQLKPFSDEMLEIYSEHSRVSEDDMKRLLSEETIIGSKLALKIGFATAVTPEDVTDEIKNKRTQSIKASIKQIGRELKTSVNDGDNPMSNTKDDDVQAVNVIQARLEMSEQRNQELQNQIDSDKPAKEQLEAKVADLTAQLAESEERQNMNAIKAQLEGLEIDAKGETANELMRDVLAKRGTKHPELFEGAGLKSLFEDAIANAGSNQADAVYGAQDKKPEIGSQSLSLSAALKGGKK